MTTAAGRLAAEVWECPNCHYRYRSPMPLKAMRCAGGHLGNRDMRRIWSKNEGGELPPEETKEDG